MKRSFLGLVSLGLLGAVSLTSTASAQFTGSGTYTIGSGGDYTTLAAFIEDVTGIIHGEGSIAVSGTTVTGTGTAFLTEVVVGDRIQVGTQLLSVLTVDSDTQLTLTAAATAVAAGASYTINRATYPTVTGDVTGLIVSNLTEAKNLQIMGDFQTHTLTIKAGPSATPRVTFTRPTDNSGLSGHVFIGGGLTSLNLISNTTDRVEIDGSNTVAGTTRDLTFYTEQNYASIVLITVAGDNDNVEIRNAIVNNNTPNTGASTTAIRFQTANVAANALGAPYAGTAGFADPDTWIVDNCEVTALGSAGQQHGIRGSVSGAPTGANAQQNWVINDCDINAVIRPTFMDAGSDGDITNNRIFSPGRAGLDTYGIFVNNARTTTTPSTSNFSGNTIVVYNTSSAAQATGAVGIRYISAGALGNTYVVENNTIYVHNTGTFTAGFEGILKGIESTSAVTNVIRHNSINLVAPGMAADAASAGMAGIVGPSGVNGNFTVQNNTIWSSVPFLALIRNARNVSGQPFASNFNNLYASGGALTGTYLTTNYVTLADWQAIPTFAPDQQSEDEDPTAITGGESLHLITLPADYATTNVIGGTLVNDIDGEARGLASVYYGADEFSANDAPTSITVASQSIAEGATGIVITEAIGLDPDSLDFPVITASTSAGTVTVTRTGMDSYRINQTTALDYEANTSFNVTLTATDRAGQQFQRIVAIPVTNVNEAPTTVTLSPATVAENSSNGTVVGTLSSVDPDAGSTFTYVFATGAGDTHNGLFQIVGDQVQVNGALDFETLPSTLSIRVESTDNGTPAQSLQAILLITLTDVVESSVSDWSLLNE